MVGIQVILSPPFACLHIDGGFIGLYVSSANQLSPHRGDHRDQQLAHFEDPGVQRRSADFQAEVRSRIMVCRCSGVWLQYLLTTVSITMRSLAWHFSMIRGGGGADTTPSSSHDWQARFSHSVTSTKYFAGSTSTWELSS
jgi:hypothetical protein